MKIQPTGSTLGAVVRDVQLELLTPEEWRDVKQAFLEFAVLVFPQQHLTESQQMSFGSHFGELSIESLPFSNEKSTGELRSLSDPLVQLFRGNEEWHTDSSFQSLSAKASILSARKVPSVGGQTEWADMRAAYDILDDEMRVRLTALHAYHSLYESQRRIGNSGDATAQGLATLHERDQTIRGQESTTGYQQATEPPLRPLIKVHPETNRPSLYIGRHAYLIEGWSSQDSVELLSELHDIACQPPRIYSHTWSVGDIAIWDNRCVLHRSRPWPPEEARVMHHTRVGGDPSTELAVNTSATLSHSLNQT